MEVVNCAINLPQNTKTLWYITKTMEDHQHRKIACLEEIAYLNGWITKEEIMKVYEELKKNQYGQYLKDVIDGKYLDILH